MYAGCRAGWSAAAMIIAAWIGVPLCAQPPSAVSAEPQPSNEVPRLLADLNSEQYEVRRQAEDALAKLATRPERRQELAQEVQQVLARAETSYEVRAALAPLAARLPAVAAGAGPVASGGEIETLIAGLESDSFATRLGAAARLEQLVNSPQSGGLVMTRLKQRLDDPRLDRDVRRQTLTLYERTREAWLVGDATQWPMPAVSETQIDEWIVDLASAVPAGILAAESRVHATAERELLDLLARDDYAVKVQPRLEQRLADAELDTAAEARLRSVYDWTRPAMVAECWNAGRHTGIQHLVLGVPNQPAGALRPSLFDRCDDHTAHCVSGNSLAPGDHPVGVLFPHPRVEMATAQFHLVNLPTPRKRMAYEYRVKAPEPQRLAELTERTLAALLKERRPLTPREVLMLEHLDAPAVSRFVGPYLQAVRDQPLSSTEANEWTRATSLHTLLCTVLAKVGTHKAVAGLTDAIRAERFQPADTQRPNQLPWLTALAIAARDPWPGVDTWLAGLIESKEPISEADAPADVGATAAAMLLKHNGVVPSAFGLKEESAGRLGSSFSKEQQRQAVQQWWTEHRTKAKP